MQTHTHTHTYTHTHTHTHTHASERASEHIAHKKGTMQQTAAVDIKT